MKTLIARFGLLGVEFVWLLPGAKRWRLGELLPR